MLPCEGEGRLVRGVMGLISIGKPQPTRYLPYRVLELLGPYIVGTWGVRERAWVNTSCTKRRGMVHIQPAKQFVWGIVRVSLGVSS